MSETDTLTEAGVRALRDIVYDREVSDAEWEKTRHNWMAPESIDWLLKHQRELPYPICRKVKL